MTTFYPLVNQPSFHEDIFRKKEFHDLYLNDSGPSVNHQEFIKRFMSSHTPYTGILLLHDMGTGKTKTTIGAFEQLRDEGTLNKFVIITPNTLLGVNYRNEIIRFYGARYAPGADEQSALTPEQIEKIMHKNISKHYSFETFVSIAKKLEQMSDESIVKIYSGRGFAVDEVHNLIIDNQYNKESLPADPELPDFIGRIKNRVYKQIYRLLHLISNSKTMLLTGTPIRDKAYQISDILNLILPLEKQLPVDQAFMDYFYRQPDDTYMFKENEKEIFKEKIKGYVSYLRAAQDPRVTLKYMGRNLGVSFDGGKIKGTVVFFHQMSDFQREHYQRAYSKDMEEKNTFLINSSQAALFVYPDGSWGDEGYKKYISSKKTIGGREIYVFNKQTAGDFSSITAAASDEDRLIAIEKYSKKYANIIRELLAARGICFVCSRVVHGSGIIILSLLLSLFGYSRSFGKETQKENRYALLSSTIDPSAAHTQTIISFVNRANNATGNFLKVIFGSDSVSEGITIKNCIRIDKLNPDWNEVSTAQFIARGYRLFSHSILLNFRKHVTVRVFKHCCSNSIEEHMFEVTQQKDITNKRLERLLKESAVDCPIFYQRNYSAADKNYSAACNYMPCRYECDDLDQLPPYNEEIRLDISTYIPFWSQEEIRKYIDAISRYFRTRYFATFDDLARITAADNYDVLLNALMQMIQTRAPIKSKFGDIMFLNEMNDLYFISHIHDAHIALTTYATFLSKCPEINFVWANIYDKNFLSILNAFNILDDEARRRLIFGAPKNIQEQIIEQTISSISSQHNQYIGFKKWVLGAYSSVIHVRNDKVISSFLEQLRCYVKGVWSDCSQQEMQMFTEKKKEKEQEVIAAAKDIGYYGIYDVKKSQFLVRDASIMEEKDKRERSRGRVCKTITKINLIKIILAIKLPYPVDYEANTSAAELRARIGGITSLKKLNTKDFVVTDLRRALYFVNKSVVELCKIIQQWFEDNSLLQQKI